MAVTINLDILKEGILRSRKTRMHPIPNYVPVDNHEELFFIETTTAGDTMLEDDCGNFLIGVEIEDEDMPESLENVANIFYKRMFKYINNKQEEIKPVDYEQKYWDCQRQIDEYERERKELQERIDILNHNWGQEYQSVEKFKSECGKLEDDKKKAEQHIKELKEKISELESKIKRLDERNTYITHQFGDERRAKERIEKRYISLHAAADSVLDIISNAIDYTKKPDPSWTLVEEHLIAAHNELVSYVQQKDDVTDFAKKSCEGCEYKYKDIIENGKLGSSPCLCCDDYALYTPTEKKSCERCQYEDYPKTFGKRCSCCEDYAFYTSKKD